MLSHRSAATLARRLTGIALAIVATTCATVAHADEFSSYALSAMFSLPSSICVFDTLSDGRILVVSGAQVYVESTPDSHSFALQGTLPGADIPSSAGAAFVRVSPDGTKIAVGNNGGSSFTNFQVGVFAFPALTGTWFTANHFDGRWINARYVALTANPSSNTSIVTALDTTSANLSNPSNPIIVDDVGGFSGGPSTNYFAVVHASAVAAALGGAGLINSGDTSKVLPLRPAAGSDFDYTIGVNLGRRALYAVNFDTSTMYEYRASVASAPALPAPATGLLACTLASFGFAGIVRRKQQV
jgi:hypothetical protein